MAAISRATGSVRAQAFLDAWRDPSVRALIAVRGGYGSVHLLPFLEKEDLRQTPKVFIGYSDLTTVLTYLTSALRHRVVPWADAGSAAGPRHRGLRSRFVPAALTNPSHWASWRRRHARDILHGRSSRAADRGNAGAARGVARHAVRVQSAARTCAVSGGCRRSGRIRLDRMLTQLRLAGVLDAASAVVLGEFTDCDEPRGEAAAQAVLADLLKDFQRTGGLWLSIGTHSAARS